MAASWDLQRLALLGKRAKRLEAIRLVLNTDYKMNPRNTPPTAGTNHGAAVSALGYGGLAARHCVNLRFSEKLVKPLDALAERYLRTRVNMIDVLQVG